MSSKPETTFISSIHKHIPREIHREKMSNPYRGGTADVWYSGTKDLWIEYKFEVLPKRSTTLIPIDTSALQNEWLEGRYAEGRDVFVIVGCREGGVIFMDRSWLSPITKEKFMNQLMSRSRIADWIISRVGYPP